MKKTRATEKKSGGYDELLIRVRDAVFNGRNPPARPRAVIADSWHRALRMGVPIGGSGPQLTRRSAPAKALPEIAPIDPVPLAEGTMPLPASLSLAAFVPLINRSLQPMLDNDVLLLALADASGTILARAGGSELSEEADNLGFRAGNSWSEWSVGTNGIGTALIERRPVQVHGAEHFCQTQLGWSCATAPVVDVRTGDPLGAIDLSTIVGRAHPTMLSLAMSLSNEVEFAIRQGHLMSLNQLRVSNWTAASKLSGAWLIVDEFGWVALSNGVVPPKRVTLPESNEPRVIIPEFGVAYMHPLAGGYLIEQIGPQAEAPVTLTVHVEVNCGSTLTIQRGSAKWLHKLTPRQTSIVKFLAEHPNGSSALEVAVGLYGATQSEVSVRAEISRMKRAIGAFIATKPYRLTVPVQIIDEA